MKKALILIVLVMFCMTTLAMAQESNEQELYNLSIQIVKLSAKKEYNNQMLADITRYLVEKAQAIDREISKLNKQRKLLKALPKPAPKQKSEPIEEPTGDKN